jgi:hypothetical protein
LGPPPAARAPPTLRRACFAGVARATLLTGELPDEPSRYLRFRAFPPCGWARRHIAVAQEGRAERANHIVAYRHRALVRRDMRGDPVDMLDHRRPPALTLCVMARVSDGAGEAMLGPSRSLDAIPWRPGLDARGTAPVIWIG